MSRDPIGEAGGLNLYGYVGNNPINVLDPFGLADAPGSGSTIVPSPTPGPGGLPVVSPSTAAGVYGESAGKGSVIIPANQIGNPKYGGNYQKMQHTGVTGSGTQYTVHYMLNPKSGEMTDFKIIKWHVPGMPKVVVPQVGNGAMIVLNLAQDLSPEINEGLRIMDNFNQEDDAGPLFFLDPRWWNNEGPYAKDCP